MYIYYPVNVLYYVNHHVLKLSFIFCWIHWEHCVGYYIFLKSNFQILFVIFINFRVSGQGKTAANVLNRSALTRACL